MVETTRDRNPDSPRASSLRRVREPGRSWLIGVAAGLLHSGLSLGYAYYLGLHAWSGPIPVQPLAAALFTAGYLIALYALATRLTRHGLLIPKAYLGAIVVIGVGTYLAISLAIPESPFQAVRAAVLALFAVATGATAGQTLRTTPKDRPSVLVLTAITLGCALVCALEAMDRMD